MREPTAAIIIVGAIVAAVLLNIEVGTHIPASRQVFINRIAGYYAATSCVASGRVAVSYIPNVDQIIAAGPLLRGAASVELIGYAEVFGQRDIAGNALRPDPQCDGFIEWRPAWRALLGWQTGREK